MRNKHCIKTRIFLLKLRKKGGVVDTVVVAATAKALIAKIFAENLNANDKESTARARVVQVSGIFKTGFCWPNLRYQN